MDRAVFNGCVLRLACAASVVKLFFASSRRLFPLCRIGPQLFGKRRFEELMNPARVDLSLQQAQAIDA